MKMTMRVNRASFQPMDVEVQYNGEVAMATISMMEVEMHDEIGMHGSWTVRANKASEVADMKAKFVPGAMVTIDTDAFTVEAPPDGESIAEPAAA